MKNWIDQPDCREWKVLISVYASCSICSNSAFSIWSWWKKWAGQKRLRGRKGRFLISGRKFRGRSWFAKITPITSTGLSKLSSRWLMASSRSPMETTSNSFGFGILKMQRRRRSGTRMTTRRIRMIELTTITSSALQRISSFLSNKQQLHSPTILKTLRRVPCPTAC